MARNLFSTEHNSVYNYDKVIRHFFKFDLNAYRIIKNDIEKNKNHFSDYIDKKQLQKEQHKRNLLKAGVVTLLTFVTSIAIILFSVEIFFYYTSLERKMELTGIALITSLLMGMVATTIFYKAEKELDNIDVLSKNAKYSINARTNSVLVKLSKESNQIDDYLHRMKRITIFHYYGIMLYAHKNKLRTEWKW